ncbi:Mur ligase family protein [Bacilliculturomica massiliensis]|uniref:Mur ligase family protein n=1 Tax=Bacilliculturomica massiliensis TaxID=1917867 RepID=UPI001030E83D|nr:UDP-N-acetylmuramoyl-L-alanyl-D-glutamate--2,6-diaminopimelate ligase [Bacilliculturomica massiliensis]
MEKNYTLGEYLDRLREEMLLLDYQIGPADLKREVCWLSYDSKDIRENTLFVCKGAHFSEKYLWEAAEAGAFCYVSEQRYETAASAVIVKDIRLAMAILANMFYHEPWKNLNLVGITGTKGKSTTAYMVRAVLDHYLQRMGRPLSAVISSIDTYDGVLNFESHLTTPEAMMLQRHFANAVESGIGYAVMEVSSQALKYHRVKDVLFDVGCFLNIGEDHISAVEHPDFDDYFESKLMLFSQCATACVNLDSNHLEEILLSAESCGRIITFGKREEAEIYGHHIVKKDGCTCFTVRTPEFEQEFRLTIPGLFNVDNALGAIAICSALGIPAEDMREGLLNARVSGRMEVFENTRRKVTVIVDYAHNRMSFDTLFDSTMREYPQCGIYAVFGCPGGKAFDRRQELGEIAGRYAKKVFLTEEDAGEEPVGEISRQIAGYVKAQGCPCELIDDREEAIRAAIAQAPENTVILLTGKGRETRQKRGTAYVDCPSDVDLVEKYLL